MTAKSSLSLQIKFVRAQVAVIFMSLPRVSAEHILNNNQGTLGNYLFFFLLGPASLFVIEYAKRPEEKILKEPDNFLSLYSGSFTSLLWSLPQSKRAALFFV